MQLFSWLRKRMTGQPHHRRGPARLSATRFRPQLEALDHRLVPSKVTPPTPSTWTVTNNLDSGAGSLRAEIGAANPGDIVVFAPGLAGQTIQLTSDELVIDKSLTIQGPGAGLLTISGGNIWRVFEVYGSTTTSPSVLMSGLTITGGNAHALSGAWEDFGGGIANEFGSTLTISGCTVSGNRAWYEGGGVLNESATLKVINSTLSGNATQDFNGGGEGGAVYNSGGGSLSLTGCTLSSNSAEAGGAIYGWGPMTVSGCTLSGNYVTGVSGWLGPGAGSAIYNAGTGTTLKNGRTIPNLTVSNSTFSGNYATYGGITLPPIYGPWTDGGGNTFQ
jgi:hypothetical protein